MAKALGAHGNLAKWSLLKVPKNKVYVFGFFANHKHQNACNFARFLNFFKKFFSVEFCITNFICAKLWQKSALQ